MVQEDYECRRRGHLLQSRYKNAHIYDRIGIIKKINVWVFYGEIKVCQSLQMREKTNRLWKFFHKTTP